MKYERFIEAGYTKSGSNNRDIFCDLAPKFWRTEMF